MKINTSTQTVKGGIMIGTHIFTGTVKIEVDLGKIYLEGNNRITDLNRFLAKFTGEKVEITVSPVEES